MTYAERTKRLLAQGLCVDCGGRKGLSRLRKRTCHDCGEVRKDFDRHRMPSGTLHKYTVDTPYAATLVCMNCGKRFHSTDRRSVRRCDPCREDLGHMADHYDLEMGALFDA